MRLARVTTLAIAVLLAARAAAAQTALSGDTIHITRADRAASRSTATCPTRLARRDARSRSGTRRIPATTLEPKVKNVGYLAYDDQVLLRRLRVRRPESVGDSRAVRRPRQHQRQLHRLRRLILDARNTGTSAVLFLATPRNIQYDAIIDDASGEDSSPDFFWDSAARITDHGWTLEMRIPFSSLRYKNGDPQTWGILLYRNYPRDLHYQFFSARMPRGGNCFVCRANIADRARAAAAGGHLVAAPYVAREQRAERPRRSGHAARRRRCEARTSASTSSTAERRQRRRRHGQPGLLAGRVRHRADRRERAVRAVLSRRSARSSSRASTCSRRRSRPSTRARSRRPIGAAASPGKPAASATPRWWPR